MSEREFENYLNLLGRLLKLSALQREQVAQELRDHMELRLDQLLAEGMSKADAVAAALDEFGDAAGLANELTRISKQRKRSMIMRYSLATLILLTVTALVTISMLPARSPVEMPSVNAADTRTQYETIDALAPGSPDQVTERKLAKRVAVNYDGIQLSDVLEDIAEQTDTDFVIKWTKLGIEPADTVVTVTLSLRDVRADTVLRFALEQVDEQYSYAIQDGVVVVSMIGDLPPDIRIYNCRDLLWPQAEPAGAEPATETAESSNAAVRSGPIRVGRGGMGMMGGAATPRKGGQPNVSLRPGIGGFRLTEHDERMEVLIALIIAAHEPDSWRRTGGDVGAIVAFDGLLIITHKSAVHHDDIARFLEMLRRANHSEGGDVISRDPATPAAP